MLNGHFVGGRFKYNVILRFLFVWFKIKLQLGVEINRLGPFFWAIAVYQTAWVCCLHQARSHFLLTSQSRKMVRTTAHILKHWCFISSRGTTAHYMRKKCHQKMYINKSQWKLITWCTFCLLLGELLIFLPVTIRCLHRYMNKDMLFLWYI